MRCMILYMIAALLAGFIAGIVFGALLNRKVSFGSKRCAKASDPVTKSFLDILRH